VLSAAGDAIGGPVGGFIGAQIGGIVDGQLFGKNGSISAEGARLSDLAVQTSTYGVTIPQLYGNVRIAGNVIWSQPIKEVAITTTSSSSGGKGGGGASVSQTQYEYSITMAIAICEGEVDSLVRVWADSLLIDPLQYASSYSFYQGTSDQLPDSIIEGFEGVGNTPAYRDISYVVIEDFPLSAFGNRVPNFTFEVQKKDWLVTSGNESVEEKIRSVVMIPGSGEFVYDTVVQSKLSGEEITGGFAENGPRTRINQHMAEDKSDAVLALDQLQENCPNLEWVGLVITWFGTSLDAGSCVILPGVEYDDVTNTQTTPDTWSVGSYVRDTAHLISADGEGNPVYGGTPSDSSVQRYINEIKNRGLKVMLYPMFFMDTENKPWRGRVTGSVFDVQQFFIKTNGYNEFIMHCANNFGATVDAFVIGSELIGLTSVKDVSDQFPAVNELVSLAANVKASVGALVKVTYAADWSEYHHTEGGWYNLDPLWASADIDMIGIDAYFPLTDSEQPLHGFDLETVKNGWNSGEGYDWVYADEARTAKQGIASEYAWKNIDWWWKNSHVNPNMITTPWVPQSKPIWFTEYGFPSVDGGTNQPNVFYDPNSSEGALPRFSTGAIDFKAQRLGIEATEEVWKNSAMVEQNFLWTWDARPYPAWPDLLDVWSDGGLWEKGHWVQGKLGQASLGAIVADICRKAGMNTLDYNVSQLTSLVEGYVIPRQNTARGILDDLRKAYFFDVVESDGVLHFVMRGQNIVATIEESELLPSNHYSLNNRDKNAGDSSGLQVMRLQEIELPQKIDVTYIDRQFNYQTGSQHAQRIVTTSKEMLTINLPVVMTPMRAKYVADVMLYNSWVERNQYSFSLSAKHMLLEPCDVIDVWQGNILHRIRINDVVVDLSGKVQVEGVAEDVAVYKVNAAAGASLANGSALMKAVSGNTNGVFLDLPLMPSDAAHDCYLRLAAYGEESGWNGGVLYRSDDGGIEYNQIGPSAVAGVVGAAQDILANCADTTRFDYTSSVTVILASGAVSSLTESAVLNGGNMAWLGGEIFQFTTATMLAVGKYRLSGLLRGRFGTDHACGGHIIGESFVLLNSAIFKSVFPLNMVGLERSYKLVSVGNTVGQTDSSSFVHQAVSLMPLSPVHVRATRNDEGDVMITWIRRTRFGGQWRDKVDVPLAEESELYDMDILDGGVIVRTVSNISNDFYSYNALEQVTDFGSIQSSLTVKIYQISSAIGRGYPRLAVV